MYFEDEREGAMNQDIRKPLKAGKGDNSCLQPLEGTWTLISAPQHPFQTSDIQNCKRINLCCFKLLNLQSFVTAIIENQHRGYLGAEANIFYFLLSHSGTPQGKQQKAVLPLSQEKENLKQKPSGAPGWLSRLSVQIQLRSGSHGSWVRAPVGLCADGSEPGACFRVCVSLSLPLPCARSVSPKNK